VLKKAALSGTAILLLAGLFYLSLNTNWRHPSSGTVAHRIAHVGAFGVLTLLLLPLARTHRETWLIIVTIFCIACGMELLQFHVFHFARQRYPIEWWDIRDNTIGLLLALLGERFTRLQT
jgi:hypothetical protein